MKIRLLLSNIILGLWIGGILGLPVGYYLSSAESPVFKKNLTVTEQATATAEAVAKKSGSSGKNGSPGTGGSSGSGNNGSSGSGSGSVGGNTGSGTGGSGGSGGGGSGTGGGGSGGGGSGGGGSGGGQTTKFSSGACTTKSNKELVTTSGVVFGTQQPGGGSSASTQAGQGVLVTYNVNGEGSYNINFPTSNNSWEGVSHVGLELFNPSSRRLKLLVAVRSLTDQGDTIVTTSADEFLLYPGKTTKVSMPIALDARSKMLKLGIPHALGSEVYSLSQYDSANTKRMVQIGVIQRESLGSAVTLRISHLFGICELGTTPPIPYVDKYGQLDNQSWPIKVTSDAQLLADAGSSESGQYPYSANSYGGWQGAPQLLSANGRWQTAKDGNGRWWIVDPNGQGFFANGVVSVNSNSLSIISGRENAFKDLPSRSDSTFGSFYHQVLDANGNTVTAYDFYAANLRRKYGSGFYQTFMDKATNRLKSWAFNVCAGCEPRMYSDLRINTTSGIAITGGFRTIVPKDFSIGGSQKLPDAFDPAFATVASQQINAELATPRAGYGTRIGYYFDNELPVGLDNGSRWRYYTVPIAVMDTDASQPAKQQFMTNLQSKYNGNIGSLNGAWGTNFASWAAFLNPYVVPSSVPSGMTTDFSDFISRYATQYYSTIRTILTNAHYTKLWLGNRFAGPPPAEFLEAASHYVDVISFNTYYLTDSHYQNLKNIDMPIYVSEKGYTSYEQGSHVRSSWLQTFTTADAIALNQEVFNNFKGWKNLVGWDQYRFGSSTPAGFSPDNDNLSTGLVEINDRPTSLVPELKAENISMITR